MALKFSLIATLVFTTLIFASLANASEIKSETAAPSTALQTGTFYGQLSLTQFQDSLSLNTPGQPTTRVLESPLGVCPGLGYRHGLSSNWGWDLNGCAFLGSSEAAVDSTTGSSSTYLSKNNFVYGLQGAAGFLWSPGGITHQIGLEIPILVRHTDISDPGSGSSFTQTSAVQTGFQIDTRFYSAKGFCFDPKLAWYQTSHTIQWSIDFALDR
jgi:hypothetical protein